MGLQNSAQENNARRGNNSTDEINQFVQSVFQDNEDLGFFPFRVDGRGNRIVNKAYIKKAKPKTLPFDVMDNGCLLLQSESNKDLFMVDLKFDTSSPTKMEIYFKAKEVRSNDSKNNVKKISSSTDPYEFKFGKGLNQHLPTGQCLFRLSDYNEAMLQCEHDYAPILVRLSMLDDTFSLEKGIDRMYIYIGIQIDSENIPHLRIEKKGTRIITLGIELGDKFLWIKDIYNSSTNTNAHQSNEDDGSSFCTICYTNQINTLILPCRHMILCDFCAKELKNRFQKCPICREGISGFVKLNEDERKSLIPIGSNTRVGNNVQNENERKVMLNDL